MESPLKFDRLLHTDVQRYVKEHEKDDEKALVLKYKEILGVPASQIAQQIAGRRKAKIKLPLFYRAPNIIYPPKLNLEQCSSESTAIFKSSLFSGKLAADLTGGLGIDSFFLSKNFKRIFHVDQNEGLVQIARHNHTTLGASNIDYRQTDAASFLNSTNDKYDLIYLDPSRRSQSDRKVFKFADCSPKLIELLPAILARSTFILVKASPIIDIQQAIRELSSVSKVYVVGIENECKEILFFIKNSKTNQITIEAVDLSGAEIDSSTFAFTLDEEHSAKVLFSEPQQYLYEPSAMILKAGAFRLVAQRFGVNKIAPSTHLYTSNDLVSQFPGKIFKVKSFLKSDPKFIHDQLPAGKANIFTRNYPLSPSQLKKKLGLKDGGEKFVIGFSDKNKKHLVLATRVK